MTSPHAGICYAGSFPDTEDVTVEEMIVCKPHCSPISTPKQRFRSTDAVEHRREGGGGGGDRIDKAPLNTEFLAVQ